MRPERLGNEDEVGEPDLQLGFREGRWKRTGAVRLHRSQAPPGRGRGLGADLGGAAVSHQLPAETGGPGGGRACVLAFSFEYSSKAIDPLVRGRHR